MSPYMKTIQEHLCWRKLCLHSLHPEANTKQIKTLWFHEEIFCAITQDRHSRTIGWHLYERSHTFCFWISPEEDNGMVIPPKPHYLFECTSFSLERKCRTRSWGPGYIVGFRRVKVPSVRSILYSTTWLFKDCGSYHGWLNRGLDCDTIHCKPVGERSEQMSDESNIVGLLLSSWWHEG
jgi:hypothetical protein